MFQPQEESADYEYPRGPLKRYHEDEEAVAESMNGSTIGFTEHRNKRLHTLPFRTSPTAPRKWSLSNTGSPFESGQRPDPAMTPPGSFSEDPSQVQRGLQQAAAQHAALQQQQSIYGHQGGIPAVTESGDMDMDMATDDMGSTSQMAYGEHNHHLAPGPAQPDQDSVIASRMPTPIQPSFAAQVRGNNWGGAAGNIMHNNISMANPEDRSVPRTLDHPAVMGEWTMVQNRSLPSPISESGVEEGGSPDMVLDSMALQGASYDQLSHEHIEGCGEHDGDLLQSPDRLGAMRSSPGPMAASSPIRGGSGGMDSDPAATPSPRKGHTRSRHTIVAWTAQPGMKRAARILEKRRRVAEKLAEFQEVATGAALSASAAPWRQRPTEGSTGSSYTSETLDGLKKVSLSAARCIPRRNPSNQRKKPANLFTMANFTTAH
ncbi:hypothetical protein SBRCBS47491_005653 [Sporothrix bragantina]|uniref:Uncharacterized protein n=1 Tax=Sporothrix bragantina TaxID=671064 RepID=A0ABP0BYD1_9PEZI